MLIHQIKPCIHRANELTKRGLLYRQVLERRCSDLDKAENEVLRQMGATLIGQDKRKLSESGGLFHVVNLIYGNS